MADYVLRTNTARIRVSPYGFHRYGRLYFDARRKLRLSRRFNPVPYYLVCHAIELLLKAFVLAKRPHVTTEAGRDRLLGKIGHNLNDALSEAEKDGLTRLVPVTDARRREIDTANKYYKSKGFEYFDIHSAVTGYGGLPDMRILDRFASSLIERIEETCRKAP